jgi:nucleoside-diphosphate-sugar epimerase
LKPANVMGATKLSAETLVHAAAERTGAVYVSVRFGNLPREPRVGRAAVPEACRSGRAGGGDAPGDDALRHDHPSGGAACAAGGCLWNPGSGETFMLDMGEPMKIA